jgi:uncharacterized membrane protein required for colicin V production
LSRKRRIDLALGIVLGIVLGIAIVVVFVFAFSEQTIDPPQLERDAPVERPAEP